MNKIFPLNGRNYEIAREDFDLHALYIDEKLWDSYATHQQAVDGIYHHAGRMDERARWKWPTLALAVVAVAGWVL